MFKRIDHIELLTLNPEKIVEFYTSLLGFSERERVSIPETPSGPLELVYLQLGDTTLEIMSYENQSAIPPRDSELRLGWQCLALEVENMDAAIQFLGEKAVRVVWGPMKKAGYARAEIRDPDGNPVELRQWY